MATELLTIKKYEFSDGTIINVKIDYPNNRVSIVDKNGSNTNFKFAERGVEFMNGWINILSAMQYAIRAARDELTAWQTAQDEKKAQQIIDIAIALGELEEGKK